MGFREGFQNGLAGFAYMQDQQDRRREQGIQDEVFQAKRKQMQVTELTQMARYLANIPAQARPQVYASMRPKLDPIAQSLGLPPAPPVWDESHLPELQQLAQWGEQAGQGAAGVQSTYIDAQGNRVAIMRDGSTQVLGQNAPNNQIVAGDGGYFGVNKTTLGAAPVMLGQGAPQRPASTFALDPGAQTALAQLPPQERAAALQAMTTGGDFHVGADGQPVQGLSPGMQLQPARKPEAAAKPTELERRVAMARQMGATEAQIKAMVVGGGQAGNAQTVKTSQATAAKLAQFNTVNRQIDRLEQAAQSIAKNPVFDGGPMDQYALKFLPQGQELEQAAASVMPVLTALTRVPGVGAQSDLEARLAQLQLPSAEFPPEVNKRAIEGLRAYMADLKAAYENLNKPAAKPADAGGWSIKALP